MSKLVVSKYIETSADGEKLIFDVDDTFASGGETDISETIAALEARIEALEASSEEPATTESDEENTDGE